jgi:hypothetical protein
MQGATAALFYFVYYSKDVAIAIVCQFMLGTAASSGKLLIEREMKLLGSK